MNTYWGMNRQRVTFDQLNLTQFVNGFVKGVLDERDKSVREKNALLSM